MALLMGGKIIINILYISTAFPKEELGSTIFTDLAQELNECGHNVSVVAADSGILTESEFALERGLRVLRVRSDDYYNVGYIKKGFAALTLPRKLKKAIMRNLREADIDLVLFESPPPTLSGVVAWAMNFFNCGSFLMLKDIFPQNGADIGLYGDKSIVYRYFRRKEKALYNVASHIGCMSEANRDYIIDHNPDLDKSKVLVFPNTKKISRDNPKVVTYRLREKYSVPADSVVFLFGGNMGKPQAMDFLADAIITLRQEPQIFFALIGRGSEKKRIAEKLDGSGCTNYLMLDNMKRDEYEEFVLECDVGLILLDHRFTIPNFPSRVLTYMEYSMPVLTATDPVTDLPKMVMEADCGLCCLSDDLAGFTSNISKLASDNRLREQMGVNGREYIAKHFDVMESVRILESV